MTPTGKFEKSFPQTFFYEQSMCKKPNQVRMNAKKKSNMPVMEMHFCNCYSFAPVTALRKCSDGASHNAVGPYLLYTIAKKGDIGMTTELSLLSTTNHTGDCCSWLT